MRLCIEDVIGTRTCYTCRQDCHRDRHWRWEGEGRGQAPPPSLRFAPPAPAWGWAEGWRRRPARARAAAPETRARLWHIYKSTSGYKPVIRKRHWCSDLYNSSMTSSVMFRLVQTCSVTSIQTSPLSEGNSRSRSPSESPSASSASCGSPRRTWSRTPGSPPGTRCCNSQGLVFRIKKKRV